MSTLVRFVSCRCARNSDSLLKTRGVHGYSTNAFYYQEPKSSPFKKFLFYGGLTGGALAFIYTYGSPRETDPKTASVEIGLFSNLKRIWNRMDRTVQKYCEPSFDVLLPAPYAGPEAKPYTLVLDLDRFLVCHIWDPVVGRWRIAKRPNVDMFLFYLAHMYELVVYSTMSQGEAEPLMEKLDPYQMISYRLYRFATKYENGIYKKDLSRLNRPMSKVVVLGHDDSFSEYPENWIPAEPWNGDANDNLLEDSLSFLESLAFSGLDDIRPVIKSYGDRPILETFELKQKAAYENMREQRMLANNSAVSRWLTSIFMPDLANQASSELELLPYEERKNVISSQRKIDFAKEMSTLRAEFERQMEANKAYLASHKMPLYDLVTKGPPPPPPEIFTTPQVSPNVS